MKSILKTKYTILTSRLVIIESIDENNKSEFYLAAKYSFQTEEDKEYFPICKANTLEECLKKGLIEYHTKFNNFRGEFGTFLDKLSHKKDHELDIADKYCISHSKECRFDDFMLEDGKAYFINDWDDCESNTITSTTPPNLKQNEKEENKDEMD